MLRLTLQTIILFDMSLHRELSHARETNLNNQLLSVFEQLNQKCIDMTDMPLDTFLDLIDDIHP